MKPSFVRLKNTAPDPAKPGNGYLTQASDFGAAYALEIRDAMLVISFTNEDGSTRSVAVPAADIHFCELAPETSDAPAAKGKRK